MKRTKKVFTNFSDVAHLFANKIQDEARHSAGNFFFEGDTIYSYGYHFPMAKHVQNDKGEHAVLFTTRTYSVSTSKHLNVTRQAVNHLNVIKCRLSSGGAGGWNRATELTHEGNFNAWLSNIESIAKGLKNARKPEIYLNGINAEMYEAKRYADFFNIAIPETLQVAGSITSKGDYLQYAERAETARVNAENAKIAKDKKEHTALLKLWRNFEKQFTQNNPLRLRDGFDYLRFETVSQRVQTSQGVQIPLEVGHKFYRLVKSVIAKGGCVNCNHTILDYSVKEINKEFIQVGCHKITLKEINKLAVALGW